MKASFKDPNVKAALTAYHPNAIRNRLPVEFKDSAIPGKRFCYPRNNHTYECARRWLERVLCEAAGPPAVAETRRRAERGPGVDVSRVRSFFGGAQEAGFQRFRTTSQNYYAYDTKALAVGESNQGIVSEKSKWIHQKQTM